MAGTILIFSGKMQNFQRLGTHNFVTISRIVRVLFSQNPRRGCINPRTNLRTPQANDTYLFKLWVYTLARDRKIDSFDKRL